MTDCPRLSVSMIRVYGGCVEPGGMLLENDGYEEACPACGETATACHWEAAESGAINTYTSLSCAHCGFFETDWSEP